MRFLSLMAGLFLTGCCSLNSSPPLKEGKGYKEVYVLKRIPTQQARGQGNAGGIETKNRIWINQSGVEVNLSNEFTIPKDVSIDMSDSVYQKLLLNINQKDFEKKMDEAGVRIIKDNNDDIFWYIRKKEDVTHEAN